MAALEGELASASQQAEALRGQLQAVTQVGAWGCWCLWWVLGAGGLCWVLAGWVGGCWLGGLVGAFAAAGGR